MTRVDQYRTNPSKAVSNFKGRWDSVFAWPSTAISTWLNGIGGGDTVWSYVASGSDADSVVSGSTLTAYKYTGSGTIEVVGGYCDILVIGGGGRGDDRNGTGELGGAGGAGGYLALEDVYMPSGTYTVSIGGSGAESKIYRVGDTSSPLQDDRMGTNAAATANKAVCASAGGKGGRINSATNSDGYGSPAVVGTHAKEDEQRGSGGGGSSHWNASQAGGASGDLGYNGAAGGGTSYHRHGGGGGGAGSTGTINNSHANSYYHKYTRGGDGVGQTISTAGGSTVYVCVGGSADAYEGYNGFDQANGNANFTDVGGHSGWQTGDADNNGAANTGSGGGGGYTVYGSGGSGMIVFLNRAEDL